jgi:hypothetical protein
VLTLNEAKRSIAQLCDVFDRNGDAGHIVKFSEFGYHWQRSRDGRRFTFPGTTRCEWLSPSEFLQPDTYTCLVGCGRNGWRMVATGLTPDDVANQRARTTAKRIRFVSETDGSEL